MPGPTLPVPDLFMQRCLQLAELGAGYAAPNPMVGTVLVHEGRIIGEGYHQHYGGAHAEVNCIAAVKEEDRHLLPQSTLYVSLEPCAHFGKTPPCADLIIARQIPKVVIGCRDPFEQVDGKGIEKLQAAGVETVLLTDENPVAIACRELNKRFFTFHTQRRPYIVLKWAQTADGKISSGTGERLLISNEQSNRLVHRWRSEEAAILVGTGTALADNPELTNRLWHGPSPVRLVIDKDLRLPASLKLFDRQVRTIVFNRHKQEEDGNLCYYQVADEAGLVHQVLQALYELKIQSVLVEGGARLLQSFIDEGMWDEARVITGHKTGPAGGLAAPDYGAAIQTNMLQAGGDTIATFRPAPAATHTGT
ncbi:MAG: bifunctional diaminohydroxyphosphoribosylaminopyrimidine deaminase/5-amino-6-(5-phosphoribosylamino)uracil reductase RibD [Chitinophagaceae bacterium]